MKNKSTLNLLRYLLSGLAGIASLGVVPFVPQEWSVAIIGLAVGVKPLFEKVGDFLDNKKLDGSFQVGTTKSPSE